MGDIDWAKENGLMTGLVIHPWMLAINAGEVQVVKDVLTIRARSWGVVRHGCRID